MESIRNDDKYIVERIKPFKVISFDIFDTLLKRNVRLPTDIFKILEIDGKNKFGNIFNNFANKRIQTEKKPEEQKSERFLLMIYMYLLTIYFLKTTYVGQKSTKLS